MCLNNFFRLNIFFLFLFGNFVFGAGNFLDYGYIEDTAQLNMKGEYEGNIYKVEVQTGQLEYITGNDGKVYPCFGIVGTGWTDTMGEVYFQYEGEQAYICSDGKWRGNAKLGAGGWIDFEDGNLSDCNSGNCEDWFSVLDFTTGFDNKFRHSKDGKNGTGKVLTDGVGFWIWDKVSTKQQFRKVFYDHISPEKTQIVVSDGKTADGETAADFSLRVKDGSGNLLEDIFVEDFTLLQSPDVLLNGGKSGLFFAGEKNKINISKLLSGGTLKGEILSVLPQNRKFRSQIEYMDKKVAFTGEINFKPPFDVQFNIRDGDGNGKKLIGYKENATLLINKNEVVKKISDFTGNVYLLGNYGYNTELGKVLTEQGNFNLKISPKNKFEIDNKLGVEYKIDGVYDILTNNGNLYKKISVKNYASNSDYIYPDKEIYESVISAKDCEDKKGNGKDICNFSLVLLNAKDYIIPNLEFDLSVEDANKGISKDKIYKSFDLNEINNSYEKGLFLSGASSKRSDNNGSFDFSVFSYKPVHKGSVAIALKNINGNSSDKYDRSQSDFSGKINNIDFEKVVDIYFTGAAISDGIVLDSDNSVNIVFEKKDINAQVNSEKYKLVGNITGCINCVFENGEGAQFIGNSFGKKNKSIKISGDVVPEYVSYYDKKYSYKIIGEKGEKEVVLDPNIKINGNLNAVPNFFGMDVLGLVNRAYNYLNVANKSNSSVVGSSIPFSDQINEIKKRVYVKQRNGNFENVTSEYTIPEIKNKGEEVYKCNGNKIKINLGENYEGDNQLFFFDCVVEINSNLYADNKSSSLDIVSFSLDIVSFSQDSSQIDYSDNNGGWKMNSNIYIANDVKTVNANITTNGSLLMKDGNGDVIVPDRRGNNSLRRQIFIKGKIVSRNTVGGGFLENDKFTLPGGKKVHKSESIFGVDVNDVAEMYDLNFLRNNYVENDGSYSTGDVSENIIDEYSCTGNSGDDELCKKPIIIKSNPNNKNLYEEN